MLSVFVLFYTYLLAKAPDRTNLLTKKKKELPVAKRRAPNSLMTINMKICPTAAERERASTFAYSSSFHRGKPD